MNPRIEILCTGDEVLTGATVNTNFSHISQKLGDAGLEVVWGTTVGDDRETLLEAFLRAGQRADAVIVNGGLGPTVDDLSQEIAAKAAGVELEFNADWFAGNGLIIDGKEGKPMSKKAKEMRDQAESHRHQKEDDPEEREGHQLAERRVGRHVSRIVILCFSHISSPLEIVGGLISD